MRWATFVHSARVVDHLPIKLTQAGFSRSLLKKADSGQSISVLIFSSRTVKGRNFLFQILCLEQGQAGFVPRICFLSKWVREIALNPNK